MKQHTLPAEEIEYRPFRIFLPIYMFLVTMVYLELISKLVTAYLGIPHVLFLVLCLLNVAPKPRAGTRILLGFMLCYYGLLAILNFLAVLIESEGNHLSIKGHFPEMLTLCLLQCGFCLRGLFFFKQHSYRKSYAN